MISRIHALQYVFTLGFKKNATVQDMARHVRWLMKFQQGPWNTVYEIPMRPVTTIRRIADVEIMDWIVMQFIVSTPTHRLRLHLLARTRLSLHRLLHCRYNSSSHSAFCNLFPLIFIWIHQGCSIMSIFWQTFIPQPDVLHSAANVHSLYQHAQSQSSIYSETQRTRWNPEHGYYRRSPTKHGSTPTTEWHLDFSYVPSPARPQTCKAEQFCS